MPDVEAVWAAFELRPEGFPALDPNAPYIQRVWREHVQPMAMKMGMTMNLPPVQPRTRLAHEAAHWARSVGRFEDYHAELFRAFFERGEDIGDTEVLGGLAVLLGLDGRALRDSLDRHEHAEGVQGDIEEAAGLEISAVPAFVAGPEAMASGVQPVEALLSLVERARRAADG